MNESLERRVWIRAGDRCEYCKIPAYVSEFTFPVDHIIAQQHGGKTTYDNLALSCPHDNFHKGPNIAGLDPVTGRLTRLFNPAARNGAPTSHGTGQYWSERRPSEERLSLCST